MKAYTFILLTVLAVAFASCKEKAIIERIPTPAYFNQVNIYFDSTQSQLLHNQWYARTYKNEPIVFRVINDTKTYSDFFSSGRPLVLPTVDFTKSTLLIGMKADYGAFINTPVNITQMTQVLTPTASGNHTLQVKVVGDAAPNSQGGEWFAFASVVPKLTGTVSLDMQYQFK